jgi:hypothetical protein
VLTLFLFGLIFLTIHFVTQVSVHIFLLKRSLGLAQLVDRGCLPGASAYSCAELDSLILDPLGDLVVYGESTIAVGSVAPF